MLKMFTAFTTEIDDMDLAIEEICGQIDLKNGLLKNSIGLLNCYSEFVDTGVVKAICDALPFDVLGCTTSGCGTNGGNHALGLTLTVLTADDVHFKAELTKPLAENRKERIYQAYEKAVSEMAEKPQFILAYLPLIFTVDGEVVLEDLRAASGDLPVFATLAVDHTRDYHTASVIMNGEVYSESMAMILLFGNVHPRFVVGGLMEEKILKQKAIITDSKDNIVKEVNGIPVVQYMQSLGLTTEDGQIQGVAATTPFLVDYNDGTRPVVRSIFAQTPEGYAVCGGRMPIGSTLSIGSIDHDSVLQATATVLKTILDAKDTSGALVYSCIGRNYALGVKTSDELDLIREQLGEKLPFMAAYSGGEVCPLYSTNGGLRNRFHNNTIIVCIL